MLTVYTLVGNNNSGRNIFGRIFSGYQPEISIDFIDNRFRTGSVANMLTLPAYKEIRNNTNLSVFLSMKKHEINTDTDHKDYPYYLHENYINYMYYTNRLNNTNCLFVKSSSTAFSEITYPIEFINKNILIDRNGIVSLLTAYFEDCDVKFENIGKEVVDYLSWNNTKDIYYTVNFEDMMTKQDIIVSEVLALLGLEEHALTKYDSYNKYLTVGEYNNINANTNLEVVYNEFKKHFVDLSNIFIPTLEEILSKGI